jgi:AcrR family transcriptional regulator
MNEKSKSEIINIRRAQLTKAAYQVVGRKGYYNFTIKDIAKEAGLSTGLVHYYFKDKQDLLFNLLKEMNHNLKEYLATSINKSEDPAEMLEIFIRQAFDLVLNQKDYTFVLFDFWTQINRNEKMRKANIKLFQSYRDECSSILRNGIKKGVFWDMDVAYYTTMIISLIQGMIIQFVIDSNAFDYMDYTTRAIEQIKAFVMKKNIN